MYTFTFCGPPLFFVVDDSRDARGVYACVRVYADPNLV